MSWFNVWDGLKNKICRYLLQRYLGQFLEEQLNLEQLKIELYNGKATIRNVSLKVEALNELFEAQGWAVEVIDGHIGVLTVTVPWNALMTNDSSVEVEDLFITLRPIKRQNDEGTSMLESMWSSVSSSMQLAEECMKQNDDSSDGPFEMQMNTIIGLEKFAETIDNVLNRIRAKFTNTVLRLEHPAVDGTRGIAININIKRFNYKNETGCDHRSSKDYNQGDDFNTTTADMEESTNIHSSSSRVNLIPTFAKHNIVLDGLTLSTEEFKIKRSNDGDQLYFERCDAQSIPILEVRDLQKIEIKMKQSEDVRGPKVLLDIELGIIHTILSPRQIHLLAEFFDAFSSGEPKTKSSSAKDSQFQNDSLENERSHRPGVVGNQGNWCDQYNETLAQSVASESLCYESERYCDSLSSSASSNSTFTKHRRICNKESCGEIVNFNLRMVSLMVLVIQEDILFESTVNTDSVLNEKSQRDMHALATKYFARLYGHDGEGSQPSQSTYSEKNHILFRMAPVFGGGTQERKKNILLLKLLLTVTKLDLFEVLDGIETPLILFDRNQNFSDGYNKRPEAKININSTTCSNSKDLSPTTIDLGLDECSIELDVSLYDRLSGILGPSPFGADFSRSLTSIKDKESSAKTGGPSTEIIITSAVCMANLRFPIVDARPIHDPERIPWWKKNIRKDYILFVFQHLRLTVVPNRIEVLASQIDSYYCESNDGSKVHLLKTCLIKSENTPSKEPLFEYPKVSIRFPEDHEISSFINKYDTEMHGEETLYSEFPKINRVNLPFGSKRVCRHSDTVHNKADAADESETVLLPGESHEIDAFCDFTFKTSKLQIDLCLPVADIILESKPLYELIYNRLNSDLFMWEPSSPILKSSTPNNAYLMNQSILNASLMDSLYIPPSVQFKGDPYESMAAEKPYSETNLQGTDSFFARSSNAESIYLSAHESKAMSSKVPHKKASNCSVQLKIGNGSMALYIPVRDNDNHVLPEQSGKFNVKLKDLKLFIVGGYSFNENLGYICLQLRDVEMYHCGLLPINVLRCVENFDSVMPEYMKSTFYKIPPGLKKVDEGQMQNREMVSIVIETKKLPKQKIKRLTIAAGVQGTTLRHNPELPTHSWLNQLIDFFDVADYPIEGYQPFGVLTEMQLHLWNCAIDYRPKFLPYRVVMEIGSFSVSSNIISSATGCNLRFIVEECILSLAPFENINENYNESKITCLPSGDLVPVFDFGLLDISLRLSEQATKKCPKFDLRCSIHDAHLRTCSDSGSALAQLIAYVASDGDLVKAFSDEDSQVSSIYSDTDIFLNTDVVAHDVSQKQQERVNSLMAEAVQETVKSSSHLAESDAGQSHDAGIEMFYFPDEGKKTKEASSPSEADNKSEFLEILNYESNVMLTSYRVRAAVNGEETLPQVKADLGEVLEKTNDRKDFSSEDEYCIIADEEKSYMNQFGIKNVTISGDPLRIVDNHFGLPLGKPDLLKSPENFPMAVSRYTLCEMTFTWHLYGGKDFPGSQLDGDDIKKEPGSKAKMSDIYKQGVAYSKQTQSVQAGKKPKEKVTWKTKGGPQRNHEVLVEIQFTKVRLSHEVYPSHTIQASRQVLLINEIEIRDRLQTSDINKFLYHPNSKKLSNKTPQNMVIIKALHVRPNPQISRTQECSLRVSLLPLRLHIDQDTLLFLGEYFSNLGDNCSEVSSKEADAQEKSVAHQSQEPVMMVGEVPEAVQDLQARELVKTNLDLLMDGGSIKSNETIAKEPLTEPSSPIYFREVIFSPEVPICFDYHGRRIELSRGPVAGLIMGLGQLQCSEIRLRKLVNRRGLLGSDKLLTYLLKEWLKDIKKNQLPNILSGVGPTYAFVQLFQGIYDLFWLPIEQYQKDGRIIRGLQLGAQSFTARTALAALEITTRIIQLLQFTAETAFDMVSPGPSVRRLRKLQKGKKKRVLRPKDIREGVTNAYIIVKEGINDSANTLIETAVTEHDQKGYTGAVGAVMRQIPQLVVCPAVLATQATTNILGGVKSSLVPEAKLEAREKWKEDTD